MQDRDLYARILGLVDPWQVRDVQLDLAGEEVRVTVAAKSTATLGCPECGKACPGYDTRQRSWRHLDTCQFKTILVADVPRVNRSEHGIHQVRVPWAEPGSGFTALMEAVVINWLRSLASIKAVAEQLRLSWDEVDGIMSRAVARGLARRKTVEVRQIGVDETSFQRRHEYVTIVIDLETGRVLHVADDRKRSSLDTYFRGLAPEHLAAIESIAMDMWGPFIASVKEHVPGAESKIAFDKFHVASHLGKAVDDVRRAEHRTLAASGDHALKGTRFALLTNPDNMSMAKRATIHVLQGLNLKAARAWSLKETAMDIWRYVSRHHAGAALREWASRAMRSRLAPIKQCARMIREHLWGIVNAMALGVTNACSESVNSMVQRVKRSACGFQNRERFKNAILFHLGGLDLYPATASVTHTSS
ncbi:MAG: ISL3 family transposase [Rhodoglobus sp.]